MVSSSLRQLRGAGQEAADIYNSYLLARRSTLQNLSLSVPDQLNKIWAAANRSTDSLTSLQDSCNSAEARIIGAVQAPSGDVNEAAVRRVFYAFDNGLNLQSVCELLVSDNDRDAFAALRANLRLLTKTGKLGYPATLTLDRQLQEAQAMIATQAAQIATSAELAAQAEVDELTVNMGRLRASFADLFQFFQTQLRPEVIAGQQNRVDSVNAWLGLGDQAIARLRARGITWDVLPKSPRIVLNSDVDQRFTRGYDTETGGEVRQPSGWTTNHDSYEISGVQGGDVLTRQWREQPLRGALMGDGRF